MTNTELVERYRMALEAVLALGKTSGATFNQAYLIAHQSLNVTEADDSSQNNALIGRYP